MEFYIDGVTEASSYKRLLCILVPGLSSTQIPRPRTVKITRVIKHPVTVRSLFKRRSLLLLYEVSPHCSRDLEVWCHCSRDLEVWCHCSSCYKLIVQTASSLCSVPLKLSLYSLTDSCVIFVHCSNELQFDRLIGQCFMACNHKMGLSEPIHQRGEPALAMATRRNNLFHCSHD